MRVLMINAWFSPENVEVLVGFLFKWCHAILLVKLVKSNVFGESTECPCVQTSFTCFILHTHET